VQIRASSIGTYNADADNPDINRDMESWLPRHIDDSTLPADDALAITFVQNEIKTLQGYYDKGKQEGL
jgi:hypothetical protein